MGFYLRGITKCVKFDKQLKNNKMNTATNNIGTFATPQILHLTQSEKNDLYNASRDFRNPTVKWMAKERIQEITDLAIANGLLIELTFAEYSEIGEWATENSPIEDEQFLVFRIAGCILISDTQGYNYAKYTSVLIANN